MKLNSIAFATLLLLAFTSPESGGARQSSSALHVRTLSGESFEISRPRLVTEKGVQRLTGLDKGIAWSRDLAGLWELSSGKHLRTGYKREDVKAWFQPRGSASLGGELVGGDPADPRLFRFRLSGSQEGSILRQHLFALRLQPVRKAKVEPVAPPNTRTIKRTFKKPSSSGQGKANPPKPKAVSKGALDGGFAKALASPPENRDLIFIEDKKKRIRSFACDVRGVDDKGVSIDFRGQLRSIPLSRIYGIVFGGLSGVEPDFDKPGEVSVELTLSDDRTFRGRLVGLDRARWTLSLADKLELGLASRWIKKAVIASDRYVNVSDLEIKDRIQKPMLGRVWPILRNHAGGEARLVLSGESYSKGFLLVPDVSFRVDFPRPFKRLLGRVGMPKSMVGSAVLRFLVDGEQIGSDYRLEADGKVQVIDLDLKGAKELSLELEHGVDLDAGARVILGNLRAINTQ